MDDMISPLQKARAAYRPRLPASLVNLSSVCIETGEPTHSCGDEEALRNLFPHTFGQAQLSLKSGGDKEQVRPLNVGVVLSGGQAPGGHNVICGLYDALCELNPASRLIGFLDGPSGICDNYFRELSADIIDAYRNTGGFDMIGSGRTKIETPQQFSKALETATTHNLDGLVIIGGDDSNTNAALLAEYFKSKNSATSVLGVPKTIDGDLKTQDVEISFGHDTACKTYSEIIGNLARDALSAKKYSFFVKLMGRSASHVTLECALQTHPNWSFIGEEVAAKKWTLRELNQQLCDVICQRAEEGKNYGVYLIPEGIVEFIPEFCTLIKELNQLLVSSQETLDQKSLQEEKISWVCDHLSPESRSCFSCLPKEIQVQLLLERDPHGNVQVSKIETERLFIQMVKEELSKRKANGEFSGSLAAQPFFCGYEGRSCPPSNFDSQYCYSLGRVAALLIKGGYTGYMSCLRQLTAPTEEWQAVALPITMMMHMELRHGKNKPVIAKALVDLEDEPFRYLERHREIWAKEDNYRYPGPVQYYGEPSLTDSCIQTLHLELSLQSTRA